MNAVPEYLSYSSLVQYEDCPRAWYLGKVVKAEPKQTWFFPVGTTVHKCIEMHIAGEPFNVKSIFYGLIAEQLKIDPDDINWLSGGSVEDPTIRAKALAQAEACVEEAIKFLDDMTVFAVEHKIKVDFPGCEVPILMYIDIVGEHKKYGPSIVDWKTGKTKPKTPLQLEVYKAGLLLQGGVWNDYISPTEFNGWWGMVNPNTTAKTARSRKVNLQSVDVSALGARFQAAYDGMKKTIYRANPGYSCKWCIQAPNCNVESLGTARSNYYDKSSEDGIPF